MKLLLNRKSGIPITILLALFPFFFVADNPNIIFPLLFGPFSLLVATGKLAFFGIIFENYSNIILSLSGFTGILLGVIFFNKSFIYKSLLLLGCVAWFFSGLITIALYSIS